MAKSTRAGSWRNDDDRAQISQPPLLWLAPQSDHGSAACAETEAFFQDCPPQSFFQLSWLALQKARREVGARTDDRAQISQPPLLWLAPQSDHGKAFFQHGLQSFFKCNSNFSATLFWLAPQSDHGRAARAEAEAVFQHGPPQSDCGGGRLTPCCSIGAGGCAESILEQGNPKPGKG